MSLRVAYLYLSMTWQVCLSSPPVNPTSTRAAARLFSTWHKIKHLENLFFGIRIIFLVFGVIEKLDFALVLIKVHISVYCLSLGSGFIIGWWDRFMLQPMQFIWFWLDTKHVTEPRLYQTLPERWYNSKLFSLSNKLFPFLLIYFLKIT